MCNRVAKKKFSRTTSLPTGKHMCERKKKNTRTPSRSRGVRIGNGLLTRRIILLVPHRGKLVNQVKRGREKQNEKTHAKQAELRKQEHRQIWRKKKCFIGGEMLLREDPPSHLTHMSEFQEVYQSDLHVTMPSPSLLLLVIIGYYARDMLLGSLSPRFRSHAPSLYFLHFFPSTN